MYVLSHVHSLLMSSRRPRSPSGGNDSPPPTKRSTGGQTGADKRTRSCSSRDAAILSSARSAPTLPPSVLRSAVAPAARACTPAVSTPRGKRDAQVQVEVEPHLQGHVHLHLVSASVSPPLWCRCGACAEAVDVSAAAAASSPSAPLTDRWVERKQLCCMEVVPAGQYNEELGPVCQLQQYTSLIRDGPDDYDARRKRIDSRGQMAATFAQCSNKAKRFVLYSALFEMLKAHRGWREGEAERLTRGSEQKTMPACLAQAVKRQWGD